MKFALGIKADGDRCGIVKKEAVDLGDDLRLARRWKRRESCFDAARLNSCSKRASNKTRNKDSNRNQAIVEIVTVDSDYETYSNNVVQSVDSDIDDLCHDEEEVLDPDYMMFLENLREDGKSYVLEIALSNGVWVNLKYEEENGSNNGLYEENLEDGKTKEKRKTENISRNQLKREKIESNRNILRTNSKRVRTESSPRALRSNSRWRKTESTVKSRRNVSRDDGESPTKTQRVRTLVSNCRRDNDSPGIFNEVVKREKVVKPVCLRNVSRRESMRHKKKSRDTRTIDEKSQPVEKKVLLQAKDHVSCAANCCSSKRASLEGTHKYNGSMNSVSTDDIYKEFVETLNEGNREFVPFAPEDVEMVHDKDEESSSDSEVIILNDKFHLLGNCLPFVSPKFATPIDLDDEVCTESPHGSKESPFRQKLMELLKKPFDNGELKDLWQKASYQRLPERHLDLRNRAVSFTIRSNNSGGKSLIDGHKSLAERIDAAKDDPHKILNLLRGFFHWLQNKPQQDAFPPWDDQECLRTLPSS